MRQRLLTSANRKWWTLAAVSLGLFMIMLDNTVVNVALPSIERDLGARLSELEWIVSGYALTFAAFLLTGGKLADLLGRRRIYVIGLAIFGGASLACALSPGAGFLIGARVVQGVGAALMNPATLSIITATFPARQRGTAIGIWVGISATALAIGPLVGGLLTEHAGWSSIFYVNVPIAAVAVAASFLLIDESRDTSEEQRLDLPGLISSGLGLFALTYALIEANAHGWTSGRIVGSFAIAAVSLAAFVVLEQRQRLPMLDLSLFRSGTFAGANTVVLLVTLAMFGILFFVSLYLQNILGYSAEKAGAAFLPMTLLIVLAAPIAGRLSDRIGSRALMTIGMTLVATQPLLLATRRPRELLGARPRDAPRRRRHAAGHDSGLGSRRARGARRQSGRRVRGAELLSADRRIDRDRPDGHDRRPRDRRLASAGVVRTRLVRRDARRSGNRRSRSRRGSDDDPLARGPRDGSEIVRS
jgi:EmrB/QacA subfamily drug resistance transporter